MSTTPITAVGKARAKAGLTQSQLGKKAGLETNFVALVCRGLVPGAKARSALADALDSSVEALWPEIFRQEAAEAARQEAREDVARREEPIEVQPFNLPALGVEGE